MAVEEVVIKITKDTKGIEDTVKQLERLKEVDKKNAEQFRASNEEFKEAAAKRARIIAEEEANIKELEKAKKKAHSPEDIKLYDDAIKQSKENISTLRGETERLGKENDKLTGALKKVGAAILAAFAVSKIKDFAKDVIMSTQATGDAFKIMMGGMKESTEYFYRTIASGDFSNLVNGLSEAYEAGVKYAEALDLLADTQRAVLIATSEYDAKLAELKLQSRDKKYSMEERQFAVNEFKKLQEEKMRLVKEQADKELAAVVDLSTSRSRLSAIALKEISASVDWQEKINKGTQIQLDIEKRIYDDRAASQGVAIAGYEITYESLFKNLTAEEKLYVQAAEAYNKLDDEIRDSLKNKFIQQNRVNQEYASGLQEIARVENGLRSEQSELNRKNNEEKIKRQKEADKLRIEAMSDGAAKEQALEELRDDEYTEKWGESEDALKVHNQNMLKIQERYNEMIFNENLKQQQLDEQRREDYNKWIQDAIDAEDKEKEKQLALTEKLLEEENKKRKSEFEKHLMFIENLSDATFDRMESNHDRVMQMLDDEIKKQEENINTQQSLAERGMNNTLSFEKTRMQELEKQRIEAQKREEKRLKAQEAAKLVLAFIDAYQSNLEAKQTPPLALTNAFKQTMLAKLLGTAIGGIFEDGGIVGVDGKGMIHGARHKQGGVLIEAEGGEGILSRKEIANMGVANFYNLKQMLKNPASDVAVVGGNSAVLQGISELNQTMKKIPSIHYGIDNLGQIVRTEVRAGLREVTTYKQRRIN